MSSNGTTPTAAARLAGKASNGAGEDGAPGRLVENVMHFARVLRVAGLPIGPGRVLDAIEAVRAVGVTRRDDLYWALHATLVNRRDQRELFDQAFHAFWRNPEIMERMLSLILPQLNLPAGEQPEMARRLAEALNPNPPPGRGDSGGEEETSIEFDATMTFSDSEKLQRMDFEMMSTAEMEAAKAALARFRLPIADVATRRRQPANRGPKVDMRATLRRALRGGGTDMVHLRRAVPRRRPPPVVVLCDISGSMAQYSRMLLHFLHAVTNDRDRIFTFLFGTRLSNVTRPLRQRDIDMALKKIGEQVQDWSGGTRIGHCLHEFNRLWSRRVLGQGAVVLLITDGLDRDAGAGLEAEIERLHKSSRRLIWLNPLLRFDGFAPKSTGVRAILPHVDEFRPVHNLNSLADLSIALSRPPPSTADAMSGWMTRLRDATPTQAAG